MNQLAQGITPMPVGQTWFSGLDLTQKRAVLIQLAGFIVQAAPMQDDFRAAASAGAVRSTRTAAVLCGMTEWRSRLYQMINLPESELEDVFVLLVSVLAIADKRRREMRPLDLERHWWHRDLSNPEVVQEILDNRDCGAL